MLQIGQQIQRLRKLKKISLTELARTSGVQIATLSRIENGKMTGTVESHIQIARSLNVDITELYQTLRPEDAVPVTPRDHLEVISAPNDKVSTEILTRQSASKKMLPSLVRLQGKSATRIEKGPAGSEKFVFVLDGTVLVRIGEQTIKLTEKSSLYFAASQPHSFENPLSGMAKFLCITTPVIL
jgi:transcriptional regulator with XRE-family HTH domain